MQDFEIDDALKAAADRVPDPLVFAVASANCENPDEPCIECQQNARFDLAFVYAFDPHANDKNPCVACFHVRWDSSGSETCVFHKAMEHSVLGNWRIGYRRNTRRQRRRSWLSRLWEALV